MFLVTGGAGFIGSNLVAALEELDRGEIVVCDRLGHDDKWRNLAKRELADFIFPENLMSFLGERRTIEAVFHLGAISATTERDADLIMESNFRLSMELWNWCALTRTRLIYASSAATYGDGAQGFADDDSIDGLARLRPMNAYGWSKHLVDRRFRRLAQAGHAAPPQWVGLKFFNVYGPNEYHKGGQRSVAHTLFETISGGDTPKLFKSHNPDYADGGQQRDFVWVGDCVDIMLWWLNNSGAPSGVYNVGTGNARSFDDLAAAVFAAMDVNPELTYIDMPEAIRDRYQYFTQADMTRLRAAGYNAPFTRLEDGVGEYVKAYLRLADPYR